MRVELSSKEPIIVGGLTIEDTAEVVQVNGGTADGPFPREGRAAYLVSRGSAREINVPSSYAMSNDSAEEIYSKMVIVIPTKNEPLGRLKGVLGGIPPQCLIVLVSNSARDKYKEEVDTLRRYCRRDGNRPALAIHQKDAGAGQAFEAAGETELTDGDHRIRNGKGEGMLLGLAVTVLFCRERKYIGYVDSDNMVPGAIQEYCRAFALGIYMNREELYTMIRIKWGSKPKPVKNQLVDAQGRSSTIVNRWFDRLFKLLLGASPAVAKNTGMMETGNAGEHAMTIELALNLPLAGGYAIEPYHIISLIYMALVDMRHAQRSNGVNGHRQSYRPGRFSAKVVQIKTTNPHIHLPGDDEHIRGMILEGLAAMFHGLPKGAQAHSSRAGANGHSGADWESQFRSELLTFIEHDENLRGDDLPKPRIYKPLASLDLRVMHNIMSQSCTTLEVIGGYELSSPWSQDSNGGRA